MTEGASGREDRRWKLVTSVSLFATAIWAVAEVAIAFLSEQPIWQLSLNEAGDFFAGFAGPPAFYWLVLGFFQQGRELRIQAEELRQSVEQFRIQSGHMGEDLKHATLLERKNQARRQFDLRQKQRSYVLEPLYRLPWIGDERAPGSIRFYDTKPGYVANPASSGDLKREIDDEISRLTYLEKQHPDIWARLFAAQARVLDDFPDRVHEFASYVSRLEHEAHQGQLNDIMFELKRDRMKVLGRMLLKIAKHSGKLSAQTETILDDPQVEKSA